MLIKNKKETGFSSSFLIMVIGQVISIFGSSLLRFGFSLYILDTTGRADIFARLLAISFLPMLFTPIGGVIADRFNRRNLMVIVDLVNSFLVILFIVFLMLNMANSIVIGIIMFLLGLIGALEQPTCSASVPALVAEYKLERANGIVSSVGAISGMLAPIAGGILYGVLGIKWLSVLCCIAFMAATIMEVFIRMPFMKRVIKGGMFCAFANDLKEGFSFITSRPLIMKSMFMAAALNLLLTPFFIVGMPIILRITMKLSDVLYGFGMAQFELATIVGALAIGFFTKQLKVKNINRWLMIISLLMIPMSFALNGKMLKYGFYSSYILYFLCAIPMIIILTMLSIYIITAVQKETPNEIMGKTLAIITGVAQCAASIGQVLFGIVFRQWSTKIHIVTMVIAIILFFLSMLAKYLFKNEVEPECSSECC